MKKYLLIFCIFFLPGLMVSAQADDPKTLYENAKTFMQAGDFDNAIIVLNRALQVDKNNLDMQKDLAMSYYYKRDYKKALDQAELLLNRDDADAVCY